MSSLFWGILYLVVIAFLITLFFNFLLRVRGPWGSFWAFFIIVLLAVLAADVWVTPVGPYYGDIHWVPPLAAGLLIALLLAATTPGPRYRSRMEAERETAREEPAAVALGTFFWFLLIFLLILIIVGFFYTL